jgi:acetyltransferase-like isoleucine patch superfamily enzyme
MNDHGLPLNPYNQHCWITFNPSIGEGTWVGAFTLLDGRGGLTIGRGCDISCGVQILTHSTVRRCLSERKYGEIDCMPTVVEDHVFVGSNAIILMGCHIGHHSIIAAGAVVIERTTVPPYSLVAGVPARVVRNLQADVEKWSSHNRAD